MDIHWVMQNRDPVTGKWETFDTGGPRDLGLFCILGGRRYSGPDPIEPIAPLRGLPADFETCDGGIDAQNGPHHKITSTGEIVWLGELSHSWLHGAEIQRYFKANPDPDYRYFYEPVDIWIQQYKFIRMVYGFDA